MFSASASWNGIPLLPVAVVLIVVFAQLVLEGFTFKDPPMERRQRQQLGRSAAAAINGASSPQAVIMCDRLYPPLAALLFLDIFYPRRVLIWMDSTLWLYEVGRRSRLKRLVFQGTTENLAVSPLRGLFAKVAIGDQQVWVNRRYFGDVRSITRRS